MPTEREIFDAALAIADPALRAAYLQEACHGDDALCKHVEGLLEAHLKLGSFMQLSDDHSDATRDLNLFEKPGVQLGPFKLLQQIGEGGMGVVWLAEQYQPVRRKVALKVIKPGMDSQQVIARFDAERQALSLMDHPNIARVLDAGMTDQGRPFFVMELVKGQPITKFCDQHQLTPRQRLELFVTVCHAIQHAHQKGVIHRDIKPTNVLVTEYDDRPVCKVIDFGVAKALNQPLTEKSMFTGMGEILGTPEYMSPEQAKVNQLDIDTRSDIYSLGVLLYELLVGMPPFNKERLRSAAWDEMLRIIREEEPPKPSTRLSDSQDSLAAISACRHTDPAKLTKLVRGELDWIVMKALEKDRGRRYETANGFAADILRYLADEPVLACPPSTGYRLRKLIRKHKAAVAVSVSTLLVLVVGIAALAVSNALIRVEQFKTSAALDAANTQRDRAVAAESQAKTRAEELKKRSDELQIVSDFQADMLEQIDATEAGRRLTEDVATKYHAALGKLGVPESEHTDRIHSFAAEWRTLNATDAAIELIDSTILRPAIKAIDQQFTEQPLVAARLQQVLADRYVQLGRYEAAEPLQQQALSTRRRLLGDNHPDTVQSINAAGRLLLEQGKLPEAERYFHEALTNSSRAKGEEDEATCLSISNMSFLLWQQGKYDEAESYLREALALSLRLQGDNDPNTINLLNNLGLLLQCEGKLSDAEPFLRKALVKTLRVNGEEHPDSLNTMNNLAALLQTQGNLNDAEALFREVVEDKRRVLGSQHHYTLKSMANLGDLLMQLGKLDEAESLLREALAQYRQQFGNDHPDTRILVNHLCELMIRQRRLNEAEPLLREQLESNRRILGNEHQNTIIALNSLGSLLREQGKVGDAEKLYREAIELSRLASNKDDRLTLKLVSDLGVLLKDDGRLDEAEPFFQEALDKRRSLFGENNIETLISIINLGMLRQAQNKFVESAELLGPIEQKVRNAFGGGDRRVLATYLASLGSVRVALRDYGAAEANLLEAHGISAKLPGGSTSNTTRKFIIAIVKLYTAWNDIEPEMGYDTKANEWKTKLDSTPATVTTSNSEKK